MKIIIPDGSSGEEIVISVTERGPMGHIKHVHIEGAMMVSATIPISIKHGTPVFTTFPGDSPTEEMTVLLSKPNNREEINVHVGRLGIEDVRENRIYLPGIDIKGSGKGEDQYLQIDAHSIGFEKRKIFKLGKLFFNKPLDKK